MRSLIMTLSAAGVASLLTLAACDKSATEARREAEEANAKAQQTARESAKEADQKVAEMQQKATEAKATADQAGKRERIELREKAQKELASVQARLEKLELEAKTAKGDALAQKQVAIAKARATRDSLSNDLAHVDTVVEGEWLAFKQRVERDLENASKGS